MSKLEKELNKHTKKEILSAFLRMFVSIKNYSGYSREVLIKRVVVEIGMSPWTRTELIEELKRGK